MEVHDFASCVPPLWVFWERIKWATCPCHKEVSWAELVTVSPAGRGADPSSPLSTIRTSPGALGPTLGSPGQERPGHFGKRLVKGQEGVAGPGAPLWGEEAKRAGAAQPGEVSQRWRGAGHQLGVAPWCCEHRSVAQGLTVYLFACVMQNVEWCFSWQPATLLRAWEGNVAATEETLATHQGPELPCLVSH